MRVPFLFCLVFFSAAALCGRVGETRESLESRLCSGGTAARLPSHNLVPEKDKTTLREIEKEFSGSAETLDRPDRGKVMSPFPLIALMPESFKTEVAFYIKTDNGKSTGLNIVSLRNWKPGMQATRPGTKKGKNTDAVLDDTLQRLFYNFTGWELMVLYVNGVSSLEVYRRIGRYLIAPERDAILQRTSGQANWQRVEQANRVHSILPYEFETDDGQLRAQSPGGDTATTLIVFNAQMANRLTEALDQKRNAILVEKMPSVEQSVDKF